MKIKTMLLVMATAMVPALAGAQTFVDQVSYMAAPGAESYGGPMPPPRDFGSGPDYGAQDYAATRPYHPQQCAAEDYWCGGACGQCAGCCRSYDIWGSAEVLLWWTKGSSLPPLVTTSPPGTLQADAGVLGRPDTTVLFGDEQGGQDMQVGGRATIGLWLDPEHQVTAVGRFYALGGDSTTFAEASDGDPILGLPFFNALLGQEDALLVAFPGLSEGSVQATYEQFNFMGAESFIEIMMERDRCRRTGLLLGYHFLRMDDRLQLDVNISDGAEFDIFDRFATQNEFHGGMIGLRSIRSRGCVSLDSLLKVSFGNMREQVTIAGEMLVNGVLVPGGGFFARETNIGEFEQNRFAFIPELTMNFKYHVNPCLNFHIGYNLIWISHAVTAGEQIDRNVNPALPVGPQVPVFQFNDENYWVQGLNFGVNFDY